MSAATILEREAAELRAALESVQALTDSEDAPHKLGLVRQAIANGLATANELQALRLQTPEVVNG